MALIRSTVDYGSIVYSSAARSHLKHLDVIQAQALRLCSGAFKTSPVSAIQVEVGEMPLELRRRHIIANYWVNLQGHNDSHPTKEVLKECWRKEGSKKDNFGYLGNKTAKELGVSDMKISSSIVHPVIAPWKMRCPEVDWYLLEVKRKEESADLVGVFNDYITEVYKNFTQIYTDGTKNPETGVTGMGVVVPARGIEINRRTSNHLAVCTVEMVAILVALRWVEKAKISKVIICSDSASALVSLISFHSSRQDILFEILYSVTRITHQGGLVIFFLGSGAHRSGGQ